MTTQGSQCKGEAKLMKWVAAERYASQRGGGWRLPTLNELLGIVEKRCSNPSINQKIFPGVIELYKGQAKYWSSTPYQEIPTLFYNVDFLHGTVDANSQGIVMGVRLVRNK